jgi:hypothetical protein
MKCQFSFLTIFVKPPVLVQNFFHPPDLPKTRRRRTVIIIRNSTGNGKFARNSIWEYGKTLATTGIVKYRHPDRAKAPPQETIS